MAWLTQRHNTYSFFVKVPIKGKCSKAYYVPRPHHANWQFALVSIGNVQVEWLKNDEPLRGLEAGKYEMVGNGTELRVRRISYADTGAYMCQASSVGGLTRDISSLVVQDEPSPSK
jgi:Immunoglobulin I-set domain